jgi:acetyl-CoA acyltransferase
MSKQLQDAYIVAATRTPVGKAPRGAFRHTRPDSLLAHVLRSVLAQAPEIDPGRVEDVIVGCAMPESEQGMNVARIGLLLAGMPNTVAGMTVNRFCSSGLTRCRSPRIGSAPERPDVLIAAGTGDMSMIPMLGRLASMPTSLPGRNLGIAYGMVSRRRRSPRAGRYRGQADAFALASHQKALAAQAAGEFAARSRLSIRENVPDLASGKVVTGIARSSAMKVRARTPAPTGWRSSSPCSRPRDRSPPGIWKCPTAPAPPYWSTTEC